MLVYHCWIARTLPKEWPLFLAAGAFCQVFCYSLGGLFSYLFQCQKQIPLEVSCLDIRAWIKEPEHLDIFPEYRAFVASVEVDWSCGCSAHRNQSSTTEPRLSAVASASVGGGRGWPGASSSGAVLQRPGAVCGERQSPRRGSQGDAVCCVRSSPMAWAGWVVHTQHLFGV